VKSKNVVARRGLKQKRSIATKLMVAVEGFHFELFGFMRIIE